MLPITQRKPPKHLGRFEVGAKIGGGGMATVYLGRDIREDGSEALVALKVIRDELANDEQFAAMFVDEAKILARLSHPNVIQTLEYGVTGQHRFIAMELLSGRTIADVWETLVEAKEAFDLGMAAWICARVAEGLHSAHELVDETGSPLSVIHRDVNPTNIFLTHSGEVKLIDFGLARARVRASKSADGIVKGKIPYLAPEQAYGRPLDRRIDIYALGTTLWEMATMKRLFKRDTDIDTLKAISDAAVPDPRDQNPDFPESLWKIIDRALRRDRDERYATAEEMRTDLDAFARASGPHAQKLAALVERLFPGGEARQAKWLRDAAAVRVPAATMAPPAPVPIASSSLLEDDDARSVPHLPARESKQTPLAEAKAEHESSPPQSRRSSKAPTRQSTRPKLESKRPKPKNKKKGKRSESASPAPVVTPEEDTRKLWMIVSAVVAALVILAVLASR
ncbi:MAG: serine/threonine protein kinase [Myxococcales bacterium]|nr:serine/threonine protein kinase [Myxococcales bacterium]